MVKRALITGITGMVGSHLADYLMQHTNWHIIGLCRWRSPLNNLHQQIEHINKAHRIELIYGDLRDSLSIIACVEKAKPDYVFHLGAQSYPQTSFSAPLDTYDTNVQGTERLLQALKRHAPEAKIHICSSSEIFGRVSQDKVPIDEECTFHPSSPYAISKVGTDLVARFYAEAYGMCVMTTRMFTHTGPRRGDVFAESSFAKQIAMIESGLLPPKLRCGNLQSLRTWADVRDAVRAYYMLVTHNPIGGAYYNIGGYYSCSVGEM
ncbi:MAG: GDP-mannose 4,6-dehydratase, partial [Pseudomonadota bacterium]